MAPMSPTNRQARWPGSYATAWCFELIVYGQRDEIDLRRGADGRDREELIKVLLRRDRLCDLKKGLEAFREILTGRDALLFIPRQYDPSTGNGSRGVTRSATMPMQRVTRQSVWCPSQKGGVRCLHWHNATSFWHPHKFDRQIRFPDEPSQNGWSWAPAQHQVVPLPTSARRFFRCHAWLSHVQTSLLIAYLTPRPVRGAMTFSPVRAPSQV